MYQVGDKIVYPMHGAGVIEAIEEKEILGNINSYYILRVPTGNISLMVPVKNAAEIGVRDVVAPEVIDRLFTHILDTNVDMHENWNKRYRENMTKIKSGDLFEIGPIYYYLMQKELEKGLSTGEKKMFGSAHQILVSEIILSKNISQKEAEELIASRLGTGETPQAISV
ncbi:MAG: CarD family transcriptional regulator [Clostridia bacterium]|nr:CarD family transcriptional regulator [Clostridia bacterium]